MTLGDRHLIPLVLAPHWDLLQPLHSTDAWAVQQPSRLSFVKRDPSTISREMARNAGNPG
jgi:hypothetical protein